MFEIAGGIILAVVVLFVLGIVFRVWIESDHPIRNLLIFLAIIFGLLAWAWDALAPYR